jgi:TM2 domain-containing membrane protein YozV
MMAAEGTSTKRIEVAIVLSWLVPGLGHMYLGRIARGLLFVVPFGVLATLVWSKALPYLVALGPYLILWLVAQLQLWKLGDRQPRDYLGRDQ